MKFRKKPVEIEAVQWIGDNFDEVKTFCPDVLHESNADHESNLVIGTLEGDMIARCGDWIIKGVNGEFYPCKPDIFEKTYEPVMGAMPDEWYKPYYKEDCINILKQEDLTDKEKVAVKEFNQNIMKRLSPKTFGS